MAATTFFLVRHAAHDRLGRVLCGRMPDVRLGETGRRQAEALAHRLSGERVSAVYTSPLERARETAAPVAAALGLEPALAEELNEIDCGEWTGLGFEALGADPRWRSWNDERADGQTPGGETMVAVQDRVAGAFEAWRERHPDDGVVAVSHADVIKAMVCRTLGLPLDRHASFEIGPASVTTLVAWEGGGKVLTLNEGARP